MTRVRIRIDDRSHDVELRRDGERVTVVVDGVEVPVDRVVPSTDGAPRVTVVIEGAEHPVQRLGLDRIVVDDVSSVFRLEEVIAAGHGAGVGAEGASVRPPMPGKVVAVRVRPGQPVGAGDVLVVLEAMKMQNEITSPAAGTVTQVHVAAGDVVEPSDVLVELGPAEAQAQDARLPA